GQMPLQRRVPKFGFRSPNRIETKPINLDTLQEICDKSKVKEINPDFLSKNGYASKNDLIKILGRGKLTSKVNVTSHYFSQSAVKAIEKSGGKVKKLVND
ncbi:MAG: uL15m family ribosomal protein, partial [Bacteroidota bacterium]|nr:uL15m family ribosomal protein [Bacteroidota bacterium]